MNSDGPSQLIARVQKAIEDRISFGPHSVWGPNDFADLAKRHIIDIALSRLNSAGILRRVTRGLYYKPRINKLTGRPSGASPAGVVDAITRRKGTRFIVDGMTAANDLGWETAVPATYTVYTDARLRPVQLGNLTITFKTVSPSRLFWSGNPAMRVVQALYYVEDKLDRDRAILADNLIRLLADPQHGQSIVHGLRSGFHTLPEWMRDFLRPHLPNQMGYEAGPADTTPGAET